MKQILRRQQVHRLFRFKIQDTKGAPACNIGQFFPIGGVSRQIVVLIIPYHYFFSEQGGCIEERLLLPHFHTLIDAPPAIPFSCIYNSVSVWNKLNECFLLGGVCNLFIKEQ